MFIILTNMVVFYLIFSVLSIKRPIKYLALLTISIGFSLLFLFIGIDSVVLFFNNTLFKLIATLVITILIYYRVLRPWVAVQKTEDRQVAIIFRAMLFILVLLISQTIIFSLGMIVHESNLISMVQE